MHGIVRLVKIPTSLQPADPGMKAMSAPVILRVYNQAIGARFYPMSASNHTSLMDLASFGTSRQFIVPSEGTQAAGVSSAPGPQLSLLTGEGWESSTCVGIG